MASFPPETTTENQKKIVLFTKTLISKIVSATMSAATSPER